MGNTQSARFSVDWPWKLQKAGAGSPAMTSKRSMVQPFTETGAPVAFVNAAFATTVPGKRS